MWKAPWKGHLGRNEDSRTPFTRIYGAGTLQTLVLDRTPWVWKSERLHSERRGSRQSRGPLRPEPRGRVGGYLRPESWQTFGPKPALFFTSSPSVVPRISPERPGVTAQFQKENSPSPEIDSEQPLTSLTLIGRHLPPP